ncbi:unnamed protein product [marine sediment metagenome]|uniref:Uncharacterized protein n=1 Tax=marine sediment metagenome TaxID=412755 RepID=X1HPE1_9ZZZZ
MPKIKLTERQIQIREAIKSGQCPHCGKTNKFRYVDKASTKITVEKGIVSYGEDTHSGEIESVRCESCDESISSDIWLNWEW